MPGWAWLLIGLVVGGFLVPFFAWVYVILKWDWPG